MSIDDVIALYQDYHWPDELRMLNRLAAGITSGVIVAIGSYRGQSDCALALDAQVPVYCIDPREAPGTHYGDVDRPYWMQNVLAMGVAEKVRPINLPSLLVPKVWSLLYYPYSKNISLLFIDGDHDRANDDLQAWWSHVVCDGLIVMHDSNFDVVKSAVKYPVSSGHMVEVERADVSIVYQKKVD